MFQKYGTSDGNYEQYGNLNLKLSERDVWSTASVYTAVQSLIFTGEQEFMRIFECASEQLVSKICAHKSMEFEGMTIQSPSKNSGSVTLSFPVCSPAANFPIGTPNVDKEVSQSKMGEALKVVCSKAKYVFSTEEIDPDKKGSYYPRLRQRRVSDDGVVHYDRMDISALKEGN